MHTLTSEARAPSTQHAREKKNKEYLGYVDVGGPTIRLYFLLVIGASDASIASQKKQFIG
jgi:hypothetical protein